jgi:AcrR family transcriptional regulator
MNRKELIQKTALETFNKEGYEHVSTYDIARKLKISQGNLTYHFPTKQQLINSLAKKMIAEIDEFILDVGNEFSLKNFYDNLYKTFEINLKYKFIYMNYSQIVLNDPDLNKYFIQNSKDRKKLLFKILSTLITNGYLSSNEILSLNNRLADLINMVAIYWVPESAIYHSNKSDSKIIQHHLQLIFMQFYPYLTDQGKNNIHPILKIN